MKTAAARLSILTLTLGLLAQSHAQPVTTNGLVAYYPFTGGSLADASGNGLNLTNIGGATLCPDRFGNANSAYRFNGSNYLAGPTSPLNQISNWTIAAWLQPAILPQTEGYAVCVGFANNSTGNGYSFGISGAGTGHIPGSNLFAFFPGVGYVGSVYAFSNTNQWHQAVLQRNGGTTMFYLDGIFVSNVAPTLYTPLTPTTFEIGGGVASKFFTGAVDDVRIYNRVLSASEVQQIYQSGSTTCVPYPATATATVVDGFVVSAAVTDGGCGYTNVPFVSIVGGAGTGATATAVVTNGVVVGITITDAGSGYPTNTQIYINGPLGVQIGIVQAVLPTFASLSIGSNYQLQVSSDLVNWTNQGPPFVATNNYMNYPQYFNVSSWSQLYFRLASP